MTYHGCEKAEITYSYMGFSGKTRCVSGSNWTESQSDLHSQVDIRFYADRTMGILFTILLFMYFLSQ